MLLELLYHAIEIGIAAAQAACEPVPTSLGNPFAVCDHVELTGLTRRNDRINAEALLDEGHETRDLDLVVLSRRAVHNFDLHSVFKLLNASSEAYTLPTPTAGRPGAVWVLSPSATAAYAQLSPIL